MSFLNILFWIYSVLILLSGITLILQKKTTTIISSLLIIHLSICGFLFLLGEIFIAIIYFVIGTIIFFIESYILIKENFETIAMSKHETYFSPTILFFSGIISAFIISILTGTEWMHLNISPKTSKEKISDYFHYIIVLSNVFIICISSIVFYKRKGVE